VERYNSITDGSHWRSEPAHGQFEASSEPIRASSGTAQDQLNASSNPTQGHKQFRATYVPASRGLARSGSPSPVPAHVWPGPGPDWHPIGLAILQLRARSESVQGQCRTSSCKATTSKYLARIQLRASSRPDQGHIRARSEPATYIKY
jgi:hypothetical protein